MGLELFDLGGRTALVTGSSQGIGLALARGLSGAGALAILNGRDATKLADAARDLRAEGAQVHELVFDATDHKAVRTAIDADEADMGAIDWARLGLNCNALAPGYFDTPLNAALVAYPEFTARLEKRTPAGRWGKVEELVGTCIFLASSASSFVNGTTVFVDGGITASL